MFSFLSPLETSKLIATYSAVKEPKLTILLNFPIEFSYFSTTGSISTFLFASFWYISKNSAVILFKPLDGVNSLYGWICLLKNLWLHHKQLDFLRFLVQLCYWGV